MKLLVSIFIITISFSCSEIVSEPKSIEKLKTMEEEALILVNTIRTSGTTCGTIKMPPVANLTLNETLNTVALLHAKDMSVKKYFAHVNLEGKTHRDRIRAGGYMDFSSGENILQNSLADAEWAVESWHNSVPHCKNMMEASYKEMGIGNESAYWVQLLASKK